MGEVLGTATLGEIVERNMANHAGRTALIYAGQTFTYGDFGRRVFRLGNGLYDRGVRRQKRVAILAQNSNAYVETYAAGEVAGFITVAINYRLAAPEILYILKDAAPDLLIFDAEYADVVDGLRGELPDLTNFICIGGEGLLPAPDWAEDYEAVLAAASDGPPPSRSRPEDIAYIIYTSGTTGHPKGAMLDHQGQMSFARQLAVDFGVRPTDRILLVMPFYHIGAKCNQLSNSLMGAAIVLHRAYDVEGVARSIEQDKVTTAHLAPIMVQDLVDLPDRDRYDHSTLKLVQYASGPMAVAPLSRAVAAYGPIFSQVYGMTETGSATVLHDYQHVLDGTEKDQRRLASAGQVATDYKIRVVREDDSDCDVEELGEILIKGPGVMRGYWNNHPATLEALDDGWMRSGDIGLMDEDSFLYVFDRKKDMIISGGENIYPREVEEAIYAHAAVMEVAVVGVPDDRWGEAVKAFVALQPGASATEDEIIEHCRAHIASYKKPKSVDFIDALPRLPNTKINKKQLRAAFWGGQTRNVN